MITLIPSPNFDQRRLPIRFVILHYTGMEDGPSALERLTDPEAKVSAHYLIHDTGDTVQMVDESDRAWHAGVSFWDGITDVNSASIGIEIVNGGHDYGLPDYPDKQIDAVTALCREIMARHAIHPHDVIGHSDIAVGRKIDPGEHFPWEHLAQAGIGLWPDQRDPDRRILFERGMRDRGVAIAQSGLALIGYAISVSGVYDPETQAVVTEFQRHFRSEQIDGVIDVETMSMIASLSSQVTNRPATIPVLKPSA